MLCLSLLRGSLRCTAVQSACSHSYSSPFLLGPEPFPVTGWVKGSFLSILCEQKGDPLKVLGRLWEQILWVQA